MDKAEIMEEKRNFKKVSKVPSESDFADVIVANMDVRPKRVSLARKRYALNDLRLSHKRSIGSVKLSFTDKFSKVSHEFPRTWQIHDSYFRHFCMRYNVKDYKLALKQVILARSCVEQIASRFMGLLSNREDCDSLENCNRLKVSALGFMYTVAVKCLPSLAYLEHVRQYMASLTESNLEDKLAISSSKYDTILDEKDCTIPFKLDVHNLAGFAPPTVFDWITRLEFENALRVIKADKLEMEAAENLKYAQLEDDLLEAENLAYAQLEDDQLEDDQMEDDQLDFAEHSHNPKEHLAPISSMKPLVT